MSAATESSVMTTEELLALPYDGRQRWLIRGSLRSRLRQAGTSDDRAPRRIQTTLGWFLGEWLERQAGSPGEIIWDRWCVCLRRHPDTALWMDLGYFPDLRWVMLGALEIPV